MTRFMISNGINVTIVDAVAVHTYPNSNIRIAYVFPQPETNSVIMDIDAPSLHIWKSDNNTVWLSNDDVTEKSNILHLERIA